MNILEYENYHENKEHSDPSFPYNTYLCSIPLDFSSVPLHWHDEVELIYVKKGQGIILVDFKKYEVQSGTITLILPGQLHSITQFEQEIMEYETILFNPAMLLSKKADNCNTKYLLPFINGKISIPSVFSKQHPYYTDIISPIDACDTINASKPFGYELFIKSQLYQFFYCLIHNCQIQETTKQDVKSYEKLKLVLKHIENHYMEDISIKEIASLAGFSESHFMRCFKESMGTSFISYLNDYRLTIASRLLIASTSPILDIAVQTGFENISYFNRSFKQKYSITPSQYRKTKGMPIKHST